MSGARPTKTTASLLPLFPRIFFLYLEPVIITIGILQSYSARLPLLSLPQPDAVPVPTANAPAVAATYLVCMMLYGLAVLLSPADARLLRRHIGIMTVADLMHWAVLAGTLAERRGGSGAGAALAVLLDTAAWDADTRTLMLGPLVTFAVKVATLLGWFGRIREE